MGDSDSENEGSQTNVNRLVIRPPGHTGDLDQCQNMLKLSESFKKCQIFKKCQNFQKVSKLANCRVVIRPPGHTA